MFYRIILFFLFPVLLNAECLTCHKNISYMDKNHSFKCEVCHIAANKKENNQCKYPVIKNPSDFKYVNLKCGKCHSDDIKKVKNSLMYTNAGIINITRYLWRIEKSVKLKYTTENIPDKTLVDDFLRKVCLRCHINTEGSKRFGEFRSSGCAACHIVYKNNGNHKHKFSKKIPVIQCLHCHNFNRVGLDYAGYFEHNYALSYRSPIINGKPQKKIYGVIQHRLNPDIHFKKGMKCIDCHSKEEIMGDGNRYLFKYQAVKVKCINCHKNKHKNDINHKNLECYTCHSLWGFQDYGMHAVREDYQGYIRWKFFKDINIPDTQKILEYSLGSYGDTSKLNIKIPVKIKNIKPFETDYISHKKKLGVWYILWTFRRWEDPVLGINQRGKISPVRPDYQFYVTWINDNMEVKVDNERMIFNWSPYVPHTTTKYGRDCYSCHFNLKTLGLGYGLIGNNGKVLNMFDMKKDKNFKIDFPLEKITTIKGKVLQKFIYPEAKPLPVNIIKKTFLERLK